MRQENRQQADKVDVRSPLRKVLLLGEHVQDLSHYAKLLEADFEVFTSDSCEAAMHSIGREAFDLVVVDQGSSAFQAHAVLQHLNRCSPCTPFVLLTRPNDLARYLRAFAATWRVTYRPWNLAQPAAWRSPCLPQR